MKMYMFDKVIQLFAKATLVVRSSCVAFESLRRFHVRACGACGDTMSRHQHGLPERLTGVQTISTSRSCSLGSYISLLKTQLRSYHTLDLLCDTQGLVWGIIGFSSPPEASFSVALLMPCKVCKRNKIFACCRGFWYCTCRLVKPLQSSRQTMCLRIQQGGQNDPHAHCPSIFGFDCICYGKVSLSLGATSETTPPHYNYQGRILWG